MENDGVKARERKKRTKIPDRQLGLNELDHET